MKIKSGSTSSIASPRRSESSGPERSPSASINSPTLASVEDSMREECRATLCKAITDLSRFRHDYAKAEPFSVHDLPSEEICRHAIAALLDDGPTVFHLISLPEVEILLHRVYRLPGPLDALSLIELCAIAAVGSQFTPSSITKQLQRRLFTTVCVLMETLAISETIYLRLMRVLLCFAMYAIAEKYLSARTFICTC
jgi:hypothetical protein